MTGDAWRIVGGKPLHGRVTPSGSKNGVLPVLAATLLLDGETTIENVPDIADVATMLALLEAVGLLVRRDGDVVRVANEGVTTHETPEDLVSRMRASHYLLGPLLSRLGRVSMATPGGCRLGRRPVTHIIDVLQAMGARGEIADRGVALQVDKLQGAVVALDPVHRNPGATFTALMAAARADGTTVIRHASYEPDVICFCRFLTCAGADIEGIGSETLTVNGAVRLQGAHHRVNSDRLEAGTFICAAAATRGEVLVEHITWEELGQTADAVAACGVHLQVSGHGLLARCPERPRGVDIETDPFPRFSTDLQPPMAAVLATAKGESRISETVYDDRLQYAPELLRMGADIELQDSRHAIIRGVPNLRGASVAGMNIRDGAALVIAALGAEGETLVAGRRYVARGYEHLEAKLQSLGARMSVVDTG